MKLVFKYPELLFIYENSVTGDKRIPRKKKF